MKCSECPHWQGNKTSEWGDCYRVVATLQPYLLDCYMSNEHGMIVKFFDVPFDPHDIKYWIHNPIWHRLYLKVKPDKLGVRMIEDTRNDVIYDSKNGERVGKLILKYFQTHKDFECEEDNTC